MTTETIALTEYLKAINDVNRMAILKLLRCGSLCVCEIFPKLGISQNLASHHLKVLKECSLVESERLGNKIMYTRNDAVIEHYQTLLAKTIQ